MSRHEEAPFEQSIDFVARHVRGECLLSRDHAMLLDEEWVEKEMHGMTECFESRRLEISGPRPMCLVEAGKPGALYGRTAETRKPRRICLVEAGKPGAVR